MDADGPLPSLCTAQSLLANAANTLWRQRRGYNGNVRQQRREREHGAGAFSLVRSCRTYAAAQIPHGRMARGLRPRGCLQMRCMQARDQAPWWRECPGLSMCTCRARAHGPTNVSGVHARMTTGNTHMLHCLRRSVRCCRALVVTRLPSSEKPRSQTRAHGGPLLRTHMNSCAGECRHARESCSWLQSARARLS